jgi:hypothetical protein
MLIGSIKSAWLLRICGNSHSAPANLNFEKDATVPREAHYFSARDAQKMAVTRSSSAKKVVRKAVAVKVTQSSGGKRVSWDDRYNQLFALREKEGHCCPLWSTTLGKWYNNQRAKFQATFQDSNHILYQYRIKKLSKLGFQFCLRNKKLKKILSGTTATTSLLFTRTSTGMPTPYKGKVS